MWKPYKYTLEEVEQIGVDNLIDKGIRFDIERLQVEQKREKQLRELMEVFGDAGVSSIS